MILHKRTGHHTAAAADHLPNAAGRRAAAHAVAEGRAAGRPARIGTEIGTGIGAERGSIVAAGGDAACWRQTQPLPAVFPATEPLIL